MRDFKFRAWVQDYIPSKEPASMVYSENVGGVGFFFKNFDGDEIMQYIGLKDKNGVEIYEGDIVTCKGYIDNLAVSHRNFDFDNVSGFYLVDGCGSVVFNSFDRVEVVGNIHQNPELLEK